jgi:glycosyltransferase involved in cell wall biosynthesis
MTINIITDAWEPQVNGVVRTYQNTIKELTKQGIRVNVIHPYSFDFKTTPLIGYPEIEIVINPWAIEHALDFMIASKYKIHIATEGPLGLYTRNYLENKHYGYTTSFHTLFPEFIEKRFKIPSSFSYPYFKWFHKGAKSVLVPTVEMKTYLETKGIKNTKVWTRGVDSEVFNPKHRDEKIDRPYILCVSRVSKEKGLDDFCKLNYTRKVLIGDGPYLEELKQKYKDVEFLGKKEGRTLAKWYANADAFVFPSKSDTFGIVILESIACGTPVASYEQPGPKEVLNNKNGCMSDDLQMNLVMCLTLDRKEVYETSKQWTWKNATKQFLEAIND